MSTCQFLSIVLALLATANPLDAQVTGGCNNTGRESDILAGTHNPISHSCPVVSVEVNILLQSVTITTPASCQSGYSFYAGTVYKCGGEAEGSHCTAQGYLVPFKVYSPAPNCPVIPADLTFGSLKEAQAALGCPEPPVVTSSCDWSAKVTRCPEPQQSSPAQNGTWSAGGLHWQGALDDALALVPSQTGSNLPWLGPLAPPVAPVNFDLQQVYSAYGPVAAVRVAASVTTSWASTETSTRATVRGVLSADGRFEIATQWPGVDPDGLPIILEQRVAFDGSILTLMPEDAPEATAWLMGSSESLIAFRYAAPWAHLLMSWLVDPVGISDHGSPDWVSADSGGSEREVSKLSGSTQQTLLIDLLNGGAPLQMERLVNGLLYSRRSFTGSLEVASGVLRPSEIVETTHIGSLGGEHAVALVIREVEPVDSLPAGFGRVNPGDDLWFVVP